MKFLRTFVIGLLAKRIFGLDNQDLSQNKSKRGLIAQTQYYGDAPTIQLLHTPTSLDFAGNAPNQLSGVLQDLSTNTPKTLILHSSNIPVKTSFDLGSRSPQVFYEYQQAPNAAFSNIHLEHKPTVDSETDPGYGYQSALPTKINPQFTQPRPPHPQPHSPPQHLPLQPDPNNQYGIVTPVQHSTVIHHGPGYSRFLYSPLPLHNPSSTTPPPVGPPQGRYSYVNGKIIQQQHQPNYPQPYPGITAPTKAHNLFVNPSPLYPPLNYNPYHVPKPLKPFRPSPQVPNAYYRANTPVPPVQAQPHPVKEEGEEEEEVEREDGQQRTPPKEEAREREEAEEEEEDEEEERRPRYRNKENKGRRDEEESEEEYEDEEDKPSKSGRYYDDDDERDRYRQSEESQEEEEDPEGEGNTRYSKFTKRKRYSRYPKPKPKKRNQNYTEYNHKSGGYSKRKSYSNHHEFPSYVRDQANDETKFPERENSDPGKPKNRVRAYYYTASSYKPTNGENGERGKAENAPVVGLKSFREENWVVTKKIEE